MKVQEIGLFEAKTNLSKLIDRVEKGETLYITRHGKKVAEVKPIEVKKKSRKGMYGCLKGGVFYMAPDFDAPLEEFKEYMP